MRRYTWLIVTTTVIGLILAACKAPSPTLSPITYQTSPISTSFPTSPTPALSGMVAFCSNRSGGYQIYVMNGDGSNVRQLTNFPPPNSEPTWSPDGSMIAFTSGKDDINNFTLYAIDVDGNNARRLLEPVAGDNWYPAWSPLGDRIIFQSNRDRNFELYTVMVDSGQLTRLTQNDRVDSMPSWSPDGRKIAFVSDRDGDGEIYVMDADGTNVVRLTHAPGEDTQPAWSPDGTKILFISDRTGNGEIYVMNADGSNQTRLTFTDTYGEWTPRWAMRGTKVLFSANYTNDWEIYLMDLDGSNLIRLTYERGDDRHAVWFDLK